MRIGIDVGRTYTRAVLMAGNEIVAGSKTDATLDLPASIASVVIPLLKARHVRLTEIDAVMIGIAPLARAFEERRGLERIGVLRLGSDMDAPLSGWPRDVVSILGTETRYLRLKPHHPGNAGVPFDTGELLDAVASLHRLGIRALVITCPDTAIQRYAEDRAATLIQSVYSNVRLSLASDFGESDGVDGENAAVTNAAINSFAHETVSSVEAELNRLRISAPVLFSRNDGTLTSSARTRSLPLFTLGSDAANGIRGAALLANLENAVVIDIGAGRTTFGMLVDGFPRVRSRTLRIGGVRARLSCPETISIDIGGGSVIRRADGGEVTIGPDCVNASLHQKALIFGGDTLTVTDVAVASGRLRVGDPSRVSRLESRLVQQALDLIQMRIDSAVELLGHDSRGLPKVLVGGGALLVAHQRGGWPLEIVPTHHQAASAVGVAMASLSEQVDRVYSYATAGREAALEQAHALVRRRLHEAGAVEVTSSIVSVEETALPAAQGDLFRVRVKATGKPPG